MPTRASLLALLATAFLCVGCGSTRSLPHTEPIALTGSSIFTSPTSFIEPVLSIPAGTDTVRYVAHLDSLYVKGRDDAVQDYEAGRAAVKLWGLGASTREADFESKGAAYRVGAQAVAECIVEKEQLVYWKGYNGRLWEMLAQEHGKEVAGAVVGSR